jgi:hypothetical protein
MVIHYKYHTHKKMRARIEPLVIHVVLLACIGLTACGPSRQEREELHAQWIQDKARCLRQAQAYVKEHQHEQMALENAAAQQSMCEMAAMGHYPDWFLKSSAI